VVAAVRKLEKSGQSLTFVRVFFNLFSHSIDGLFFVFTTVKMKGPNKLNQPTKKLFETLITVWWGPIKGTVNQEWPTYCLTAILYTVHHFNLTF
jgi:hypothetical protein